MTEWEILPFYYKDHEEPPALFFDNGPRRGAFVERQDGNDDWWNKLGVEDSDDDGEEVTVTDTVVVNEEEEDNDPLHQHPRKIDNSRTIKPPGMYPRNKFSGNGGDPPVQVSSCRALSHYVRGGCHDDVILTSHPQLVELRVRI